MIEFISLVDGLSEIEQCVPKPASKYIPDWWKKTPTVPPNHTINNSFTGNVKNCVSFPDYFSKGYIIPMWSDTIIYFDEKTKNWAWKTPDVSNRFNWSYAPDSIFLDNVEASYGGKKQATALFKANCPWKMITPKGYSTYQLPLFFHFNKDYTLIPGIADTDLLHDISAFILFHSDQKEIFIPRGTPFMHCVPFQREEIGMTFRDKTDADMLLLKKNDLRYATTFVERKEYVSHRKQVNND